jgi:hypothetical protein
MMQQAMVASTTMCGKKMLEEREGKQKMEMMLKKL